MKRRIFGLENEYGLTCTLNGQRRLSPKRRALLVREGDPGRAERERVLENGARLYLDTGFHPEYATPECDDVAELVIHDKAASASSKTSCTRREAPALRTGSRATSSCSRTTPTRRAIRTAPRELPREPDVSFQRLAEALIPFFVTRQIFAGPARCLQTAARFHYCLSQRAQHICQEFPARPRPRALDHQHARRAHADAERYRRPARHRRRLEHVRSRDVSKNWKRPPSCWT